MHGEYAYEKGPDWHFRMENVILDTLLKTGGFAMIYKATINKYGKPKECVVIHLQVCTENLPESFINCWFLIPQ